MNISLAENKVVGIMKPGHCFTIEPMINQGNILFFLLFLKAILRPPLPLRPPGHFQSRAQRC